MIKEGKKNRIVFLNLKNIDDNMRTGIRHGFYDAGKKLVKDTNKDILRKGRAGRVYTKKGLGSHKASVPGEAPANWTGKLRKSLDFSVHGWGKMEFGYDDSVAYGKWLEDGTKKKGGGVKMKPRPGLIINIRKNNKNTRKYLVSAVDREIKGK